MIEFRVQSSEFRVIICSILFLLFTFCSLLLAQPAYAQSLDTNSCRASSMDSYISIYNFARPNSSGYSFPSPLDPKYRQDFQRAKELAIKYAPAVEADPVMLVWWIFFETSGRNGKIDSYSWSNCLDSNYDINYNCTAAGSGKWQLGYGQQFATYPVLPDVFTFIYGNGAANDAQKTQQVGQNVLDKAGQTKQFPNKSVNQLISEYKSPDNSTSNDAKYWISVLMRDQEISAMMTAQAVQGDINRAKSTGRSYDQLLASFTPYYRTNWQATSNLMNDVLLAWNATAENEAQLQQCADLNPQKKLNPGSSNNQPTTPNSSSGVTREEIAVYNISNGNLPPEIVNQPVPEENAIISALKGIPNFIQSFFSAPNQPAKYYTQAQRVNEGDVPTQVIPQGNSFFDNLISFVGKNTGFYTAYLPPQMVSDSKVLGVNLSTDPSSSDKLDEIKDYEGAFETTHFPDGVNPITATNNSSPSNTSSSNSTSPGGTSSQNTSGSNTSLESRMIDMVNEERRKDGKAALTFDPSLLPLARDMAAELPNMYLNNTLFYSHTNRAGEDLTKRAARLNITKDTTLFENLAFAPTFEGVFQELLKSPAHRANMLQRGITKVAIAVHQQGNMFFVAQEFK